MAKIKINRQSAFIRQGFSVGVGGKTSAGGRILTREQKRWQVRAAFGERG